MEQRGKQSGDAPRRRNTRRRRVFSDGGRLYLAHCVRAGKSEEELWDFIGDNHPTSYSSIDHYIRSGRSPSNRVRDPLVEFLKDTPAAITRSWFDRSWEHLSLLDAFVEATHEDAGLHNRFCGDFVRIFPTSPEGNDRQGASTAQKGLACRNLKVALGVEGVLRWSQEDEDEPGKPRMEGFGLYDASTTFLIGFNSPRHIVSYFILRRPNLELHNLGVRLIGLQASTMPFGPENGIAIAKRNVLVLPALWAEWGDGASCPGAVREWLLADNYGLRVDLVSERNHNAD